LVRGALHRKLEFGENRRFGFPAKQAETYNASGIDGRVCRNKPEAPAMKLSLTTASISAILAAAHPAAAETIFVSNEKDNSVTILDGATLEVIKTVPVGQRPRGITLSIDNQVL
jgi:YVTN family beta-propeller protein